MAIADVLRVFRDLKRERTIRVYRNQDKSRVFLLDEVVSRARLRALFRRLDHDTTLRRRYESLVGKSP